MRRYGNTPGVSQHRVGTQGRAAISTSRVGSGQSPHGTEWEGRSRLTLSTGQYRSVAHKPATSENRSDSGARGPLLRTKQNLPRNLHRWTPTSGRSAAIVFRILHREMGG